MLKLKKVKKFFYINTLYSLFICLLLENNLDENFYFFSSKFSKSIAKNIKNKIVIKEKRSLRIIDYILGAIFFRIIKLIFSKRVKNKDFYICDKGKYAQYFFNNYEANFILVEDGTMNYNIQDLEKVITKSKIKLSFSKKLRKNFVYGVKKIYPSLGISEKIQKIILTGILPIPEIINPK